MNPVNRSVISEKIKSPLLNVLTSKRVLVGAGIVVGAAIAFFILRPVVRNLIKTGQDRKRLRDAAKDQDKFNTTLSWSLSEYSMMADAIEEAVRGVGNTDEDAIYDVFRKIKTNGDFLKLQQVYGIRYKDEDLAESIVNDLDSGEIAKVNNILASNGITYRI